MLTGARYFIGPGPAITWPAPSAISYGTALGSTQLGATTAIPGTFTYTPAPGSILPAGGHTLTATFTPTDTQSYPLTSATVSLTVSPATPTITWPVSSAITYGTALSSTQLDASASVPGTFVYSRAIGTVLQAGTQTLTATFTPTDGTNYLSATATVRLTVSQAAPKITWATPATIVFGTPLGATQLDASASIAGTFVYSPTSGTVLPAGNQILSATFTPTDASDYTTATVTVVLPVANPSPSLSALSPAHTPAGGSGFSLSLNGAGFMPTSIVTWGSTPLATQYVTATQLAASVPASIIATAGTVTVTVQTPAPGGGSSGTLQFQIDSAAAQGAVAPSFTTVTATISSSSSASYTVTLPSSVISASVSCLNLPAGATCTYANGAVTLSTAANTPPGTYVITVVFTETLQGVATAFFYLPFLLLPLVLYRRKLRGSTRAIIAFGLLTLIAGGLLITGCGAGGAGSGGGSTTHQATSSAAVTLIVQ